MGENIRRLTELERICSEPFREESIDVSNLDEFSRRLVEEAHKNDYLVYKLNRYPGAVILGMRHKVIGGDYQIVQTENIKNILGALYKKEDKLLLEVVGSAEVDLSEYTDPFLNRVKYALDGRLRSVIFNNNPLLWAGALIASQELERVERVSGKESDKYEMAVGEYLKAIFEDRDESFCRDEVIGLVPLINRTSVTYSPLPENGRLWQVVGLMHLHARNIEMILTEEKIPFAMLLPREGERK